MPNFEFSQLNWLAIGVATLAYFAVGAIWYSVLFKNAWLKASGVKMDDPNAKKGAGAAFGITLVLEFVACTGLAIIVARTGVTGGIISGLKIGALAGICFSATAISISYLYQMKPKVLSLVDSGYHIVGCTLAAVILCMWR